VKSLGIFSHTALYDPSYTALYYKLPPPLDQTTPLEVLISVTQLYAVVTVTLSGYRLLLREGLLKRSYLTRVLALLPPDNELLKRRVRNDLSLSLRNALCGSCVTVIGLSFVWLLANSYHVTATEWIGGTEGLIRALEAMEAGLAVLLYYMLQDAREKAKKALRIQRGDVEEEWYAEAEGWVPFWEEGVDDGVEHGIQTDIKALNQIFHQKKHKHSSKSLSLELINLAQKCRKEAFCNYIYFLLNLLAFYGYFVSILCYYFPYDDQDPTYIRYIKFGMETYSADWWGNFVGDFSWTLEPLVILASPYYLAPTALATKPKKKKE